MKLKRLIKDQSKLFWVFHLGGWALWGTFVKYLLTLVTLEEVAPNYAAYVAVISVVGMLITLVLRFLWLDRNSQGHGSLV